MSDDQAMQTKVRTLALLAATGAAGFLIAPTLEKRVEALEQRVDQLERQLAGGQQVPGRERPRAQTPLDKFRAELAACTDANAALSLAQKFRSDTMKRLSESSRDTSLKPSQKHDLRLQAFESVDNSAELLKRRLAEIREGQMRREMDERGKSGERRRRRRK